MSDHPKPVRKIAVPIVESAEQHADRLAFGTFLESTRPERDAAMAKVDALIHEAANPSPDSTTTPTPEDA